MVSKTKVGWIIFALLIIPILVCGQGRPNGGMMKWNNDSLFVRMYNPALVQTVKVVVEEVQNFVPVKGMTVGVKLQTMANDELLSVHIGPVFYLDSEGIEFKAGEELRIEGAFAMYEEEEILIAKIIYRGEEEIVLRDDFGRPKWAGWMRGQRKGRAN
ncbi:MAG: hypothetical protein BalsKO_31350 [Balneolaceae bacterium]